MYMSVHYTWESFNMVIDIAFTIQREALLGLQTYVCNAAIERSVAVLRFSYRNYLID